MAPPSLSFGISLRQHPVELFEERDLEFESVFLQRRVRSEPCGYRDLEARVGWDFRRQVELAVLPRRVLPIPPAPVSVTRRWAAVWLAWL